MQRTIRWSPDGHRPGRRPWSAAAVAVILAATTAVACPSVASASSPTTTAGGRGGIPAAAFHDHTGVTATAIHVGNVSTLTGGLFAGSPTGVKAYFDYVNSTGGVHGRKLYVDTTDDGYGNGANNKAQTQADVAKDFAMVGSFSLNDAYGGTVLAAHPSVPDVTEAVANTTNNLPNTFSPQPAAGGWEEAPLQYFKQRYPSDVRHAGALIVNQSTAEFQWDGEHAAMNHLGYKVVYDPTFEETTTDFTQYVVAMRNAGVKILFIEQMPENYAAAVYKALDQQDFHPVVVLGLSTYSSKLIPASGGASAVDGSYLQQPAALFLGGDAATIPAVSTFETWVQKADPGFAPDFFTLAGWASAELFVDALRKAGKDPSRGSELQALRAMTSFSAGNLLATVDPAAKAPASCFVLARAVKGSFQRLDDPPVDGPTHGYRCGGYYWPPGVKH